MLTGLQSADNRELCKTAGVRPGIRFSRTYVSGLVWLNTQSEGLMLQGLGVQFPPQTLML